MKNFNFSKNNWYIFLLGIVLLFMGYTFMWANFINISAVILVFAYVVVFPLSIMYKKK